MRKIITYIATSADGYIARPDGDINWLNDQPPAEDYDMEAFFNTVDTVIWGRKTWSPGGGGFGPEFKNYVFTSKPPGRPPAGTEFISEPVSSFAKRLRSAPGKDIWLMGGSGIIASFLDAGEIDQFIIHVMPVFIGEGIPLVAPRHRSLLLDLHSAESYSNGMVRLHYDVRRKKAGKKTGAKTGKKAGAKRTTRKRSPARS